MQKQDLLIKEVDKAIEIYEEMLELNPNDNQGIRYLLSTLLLSKNNLTKFELFIKNNEEEDCAVWNYNNALYHFKKYGQSAKSDKVLLKAYNSNEYVIDYMLGIKKMPPNNLNISEEDTKTKQFLMLMMLGQFGIKHLKHLTGFMNLNKKD